MLHDFHSRIGTFTREGVANLAQSFVDYVTVKKIDELEKYIASSLKHNLFGSDADFYEKLDNLRRLRNRVHIQNTKGDFEPDDYHAFSERKRFDAETALEKTLKTMATKYPRASHLHHVADFNLPWKEHYQYGVPTEPAPAPTQRLPQLP